MNKLDKKLQVIGQYKRMALMTHAVIGYPSLSATKRIVRSMIASGVDLIELQIPFSDPLADGPTIMKACELALSQGIKVKDAFAVMKELSSETTVPFLFMAYYNTVFHYGVEKFVKHAKNAGASGLIVPDMPLDEEGEEHFYALCKRYEMHAIHVVSPASTEERLKKNAVVATGFVYATARQGITGAKAELASQTIQFLSRVKKHFSIPIAVGFGISTKEQVTALTGHAEIAVVGSAIIDKITRGEEVEDFLGRFSMIK